ncbi:MAG: hypothetical protein JOS17DRAFT_778638 [Linnemannia elongata]|nr:MAG: hypothetical protein JOS17DRAFT_778638 [Linnemannia elongata]
MMTPFPSDTGHWTDSLPQRTSSPSVSPSPQTLPAPASTETNNPVTARAGRLSLPLPPTPKRQHNAAYPVCTGSAKNPGRSLIQSMKVDCGGDGWKNESTFYYSDQDVGGDTAVFPTHESTAIWQLACATIGKTGFTSIRLVVKNKVYAASLSVRMLQCLSTMFIWLAGESES